MANQVLDELAASARIEEALDYVRFDEIARLADRASSYWRSTMLAAVSALRQLSAARIVVAAPVIAASACREIQRQADEVVAALIPERFYAVG